MILSFEALFFFGRKFAVQCLESKVIPILAGIIAFIDTNRNLDILSSSSYNKEWKIDIWLQIFNNPDLTQLKYSLMVSPSRQQELQEVAITTTSVDGNVFSALMPFSWLIFEQIDEVLRKTIETKDDQCKFFFYINIQKTWVIIQQHSRYIVVLLVEEAGIQYTLIILHIFNPTPNFQNHVVYGKFLPLYITTLTYRQK